MDKHPIARYRRARGYTQAELAGHVGVHRNTVAGWENGRRPYATHIPKLAEVLAIDALELVTQITDWKDSN